MNDDRRPASVSDLLRDSPSNWGKWGPDDEVGALNYLTAAVILESVSSVRQGKVFTLQMPMADPKGDPVFPGRVGAQRFMVLDKGDYLAGRGPWFPGDMEYADDAMFCYLQGSTQYDALGHVWYDDKIWNGYDAMSTIGGLSKASVMSTAERGVVGRGVLLDVARFRGRERMEPGELVDLDDLLACAAAQGTELRKHDVLLVRTGWLGRYAEVGQAAFFSDLREPGLRYSPELVEWFRDMEIPNLVTDSFANETNADPGTGFITTLHGALMRNLGVSMTEMASLDELAADCAGDGQFDFLYVAAPLKVIEGAGAPVNPVVIK
jgi:kynurenine formamidase